MVDQDQAVNIDINLMAVSVESETQGMSENIGVSVALWRLKELIKGYQFAVRSGYGQAQ
jgi:hypothetical protein